jgi:hypothetical protein
LKNYRGTGEKEGEKQKKEQKKGRGRQKTASRPIV